MRKVFHYLKLYLFDSMFVLNTTYMYYLHVFKYHDSDPANESRSQK